MSRISKKIILVVLMFSFSTNASAGWWGDSWSWIKSYKKTVYTVGSAVGIAGFVVGMRKWIAKNRLEQEKRKKQLEHEKDIEAYRRGTLRREKQENINIEKEKKQWQKDVKFFRLKRKKQLLKTLKSFEGGEVNFEQKVENFKKKIEESSNIKTLFVKGAIEEDKFFDTHRIQKIEVPENAEIKIFTDLHSCAEALRQFLIWMKAKRWTDENDIYKLKDPTKYLIFLGDYVDRGIEGIEVLYHLMNLYIKNPNNVVLLGGNHEDKNYWLVNGFYFEGINFGLKHKFMMNEMHKIFNHLPSMCAVVHKDAKGKKRCYLFSHSSFDGTLNLKNLVTFEGISYKTISKKSAHKMRWNDFIPNKKNVEKASTRGGDVVEQSKDYFVDYCKQQNKDLSAEIVGLFRGHQHVYFSSQLNDGNGMYILNSEKQWSGKPQDSFLVKDLSKKEPFVITLDMFRYSPIYFGWNKIGNKPLSMKDITGKGMKNMQKGGELYSNFLLVKGKDYKGQDKATIISLKLDKDFNNCKITGEVMKRVKLEKKK